MMQSLVKPLSAIMTQTIHGEDVMVAGMTLDSRQVEQDYLFCAVKGEATDGHQYIDQAVANGAAALAVENASALNEAFGKPYIVEPMLKSQLGDIAAKFYNQPTQQMYVVGVTGTNGKTSVTRFVSQLFEKMHKACGEIGTLGVRYQAQTLPTNNTTPDAISLQKTFYQMLQADVKYAAMEVSSHAMAQNRCQGVNFDTAIFTNMSHDHLDYHRTMAAYTAAKAQLFAVDSLKLAVVNIDDAASSAMLAAVGKHTNIMRYSLNKANADVYLSDIEFKGNGYQAQLHYLDETCSVFMPVLGDFNLYNVLAAIIAVKESDAAISLAKIAEAVASIVPVSGRMQMLENSQNITAIVDYAHTPDALENVLMHLQQLKTGKLITVFGCGGDRDREKRPVMAAVAEKYSDVVIVTADNPRSESIDSINQQIVAGFTAQEFSVVEDRAQAIKQAVDLAMAGDIVLVAGKGHEKTQMINGVAYPFDDVAVLAAALEEKPC